MTKCQNSTFRQFPWGGDRGSRACNHLKAELASCMSIFGPGQLKNGKQLSFRHSMAKNALKEQIRPSFVFLFHTKRLNKRNATNRELFILRLLTEFCCKLRLINAKFRFYALPRSQ